MRTIAAWIGAEPCAHRMTCRRKRPIQAPVLRRIGSKSAVSALLSLSGAEFDRGRRARDSPARFAAIEAHPISSHARRSDGRSPAGLAVGGREESPGSTEARCRVTPGGGDPRESATETHRQARLSVGRPSGECPKGRLHGTAWAARVKWCGKSAPRRRQRRRQGKPHREQDQVGAAGGVPVSRSRGVAGRACRAAARVGRARRSATNVPDEWPSPPQTRGGTEPGLQTVWHSNLKQQLMKPRVGSLFRLDRDRMALVRRGLTHLRDCPGIPRLSGARSTVALFYRFDKMLRNVTQCYMTKTRTK